MKHVHVIFRFDEDRRLGKEVQLFWLYDNNTEQLYTTIPAGLQVDETTFPGQCWRAVPRRDQTTGRHCPAAACCGHHLAAACACCVLTLIPSPGSATLARATTCSRTARRASRSDGAYHVDRRAARLPLPPTVKLAQRVRVLALGDGSATPSLVGELAQEGASTRRGGAKFKVVKSSGPRPAAAADHGGPMLTLAALAVLTPAPHRLTPASMTPPRPAHARLPHPLPPPGESRGGAARGHQ